MPTPPTNPHLTTLDTLIAIGTALAQDIQHARQANEITPTQAAEAFERVARATRRTILLAARLAEPAPGAVKTPTPTEPEAKAARREIIRTVEDAITREARLEAPARHALEAEFRERLDAPELAEDLAARPVAAIVTDILRDLDLGRLPFTEGPNWRRRTPASIRRLHALAAGAPPPPEPEPRPDPNPDPPPTPSPGQPRATHTQPHPEPGIPAALQRLHRHILDPVHTSPHAEDPPPQH